MRNLLDDAIKNYDTVFKEIYMLFEVTPSNIVRIGKREQKHFIGKSLSNEYKQKISDTLKGRTISEHHAKRISEAMMGMKLLKKLVKMSQNHANVNGENNPRFLKDLPSNRELYVEWDRKSFK